MFSKVESNCCIINCIVYTCEVVVLFSNFAFQLFQKAGPDLHSSTSLMKTYLVTSAVRRNSTTSEMTSARVMDRKGAFRRWPQLDATQIAVLFLVCVCCHLANANPDAKRLYDDLLFQNDYNVLIRPVSNHQNNLTVEINLKLSALVDVVSKSTILILDILLYKLELDINCIGLHVT